MMPRSPSAFRALVRVELRAFRRHPGRSLLLLLLVAVPVAAIVGGSTLLRIVGPTAAERCRQELGGAALAVVTDGGHAPAARVGALLPPQTDVDTVVTGVETVAVPGRRLHGNLVAAPPTTLGEGGLGAGLLVLRSGRLPANAGEVALSPSLIAALDRAPGDSVTLNYGGRRAITGIVVDPEALDRPLIVRTPAVVEERSQQRLLLAPPLDSVGAVTARLRAAGLSVRTPGEAARPDPILHAAIGFVGGMGLLEAGLVIAAALTVGLRRRQREIGLLGSVGAAPGVIQGALLTAVALNAAAGAAVGALAGATVAWGLHPHLDGWTRRLNGPFEIDLLYFGLAPLFGVVTAVLAAATPARGATRLPIRVALGGRRPEMRDSRRWLALGAGVVAAGLAAIVLIPHGHPVVTGISLLGGSFLGVLGFGFLSPWVLSALGRRAGGLPLTLRLAARDAGRFSSRNGPVVTAVLAGMAISVTIGALLASLDVYVRSRPAPYRPDQLLVEGPAAADVARRIGDELRATAVAPLAAASRRGVPLRARAAGAAPDDPGGWIATGDETLLRALGGDAATAACRSGGLVAFHPAADVDSVDLSSERGFTPFARRAIAGVDPGPRTTGPAYALSREWLDAGGFESGPPPRRALVPWLVRLGRPVDAAALRKAQSLAAAAPGTSVDAARLHDGPERGFYYIIFAICLATGLVVVLVATALSAVEAREDARTLLAVGAAPGILRDHQAARAGYLAFLGCLLAVPAGLIPVAGFLAETNVGLRFTMPWRDLALIVVGLPFAAWSLTRLWMARPRPADLFRTTTLLALWVVAAPAGAEPRPTVAWEPYVGVATDGTPIRGELGRIRVPEEWSRPEGAMIEIAFVRYRTTHPNPGPPLLYLEGGPGGSGVDGCAFVATHPRLRLLEQCDVIGIDQRGTGRSRPNLTEPEYPYTLPLDRPLTRDAELAAFRTASTRAADHWASRGVNLSAWTTAASADDIDAVRAALGLDRVALYGASYGSHLALACLRRHGDRIARAVLAKVEGPDQTWKLPSATQARLEELTALAASDPLARAVTSDLTRTLHDLLERLEAAPVTVLVAPDSAAAPVAVTVGAWDLRCAVAAATATTRGNAGLLTFVRRLAAGDWTPLGATALGARRGRGASALALLMDCASGATAVRRERLARERSDPAFLLSDAVSAPFHPETCAGLPITDLGNAFRGPLTCDVPVLFVSGTLDGRTPPSNVDEIRAGFARSAHVVVTGAGHDARELLSDEYRALLQAFLRGEPAADDTLRLPFRFEIETPETAAPGRREARTENPAPRPERGGLRHSPK